NGLLYPVNFLSAFLPVHLALGYGCATHIALAGVFALATGRAVGSSLVASFTVALGYMLNSFFLIELFRPFYLSALSLVPLIALLSARTIVTPRISSSTWLGVAVALQFFTGDSQIICDEAYAVVLSAAVWSVWTRPSLCTIVAALRSACVAILVATLVAL